jgi:hypothetical protein
MLIVQCEQKSEEWYQARLGIPTASEFKKIYTATGKESRTAETYKWHLLGEWFTGRPQDSYNGGWMQRGTAFEDEARRLYSFITGLQVETAGFVYSDDNKLFGCSPDGLVIDPEWGEGGIEIKCPSPGVHLSYMLNSSIPYEYVPQVQGSMLITGRTWWDWLSYHPDLPLIRIRCLRDEKYIEGLSRSLYNFVNDLMRHRNELLKLGLEPAQRVRLEPEGHVDVTGDDKQDGDN